MAGTFYSNGQLTLMLGAGTGYTPGNDFSPFGKNLAAVFANGFIIDIFDSLYAESANFSAGFSIAVSIHGSSPFNVLKRQVAVVCVDFLKTSEIAYRQAASALRLINLGRIGGEGNIVSGRLSAAGAGIREISLIHHDFIGCAFGAGLVLVRTGL